MSAFRPSQGGPNEDQCAQLAQGQDHRGEQGATTSHVKIDVGGTIVTASITNTSVDELSLKVGKTAYAVIKASDVMVGID